MTVDLRDPVLFSPTVSLTPIDATRPVAIGRGPVSPYRVSVPARPDESASVLRARLLRAASRLEAMLSAVGEAPVRWVLRLERDGVRTAMPLPSTAIGEDGVQLQRRLPDAALRDVECLVLEARVREGGRRGESRGPVGTHRPGMPARIPLAPAQASA